MGDPVVIATTSREGKVTKVLRPGDILLSYRRILQGDNSPEALMYPPRWDGSVQEGIVTEPEPIEVLSPQINRKPIKVRGQFAGEEMPSCYLVSACWGSGERAFIPDGSRVPGRWIRGVEVRYACPSCMSLGLNACELDHERVVRGTCLVCEFCKAQVWTARHKVIITPDPASEGETSVEWAY